MNDITWMVRYIICDASTDFIDEEHEYFTKNADDLFKTLNTLQDNPEVFRIIGVFTCEFNPVSRFALTILEKSIENENKKNG